MMAAIPIAIHIQAPTDKPPEASLDGGLVSPVDGAEGVAVDEDSVVDAKLTPGGQVIVSIPSGFSHGMVVVCMEDV